MIGASVVMVTVATLFVVFGLFRLADGKGCHGCSGSGDGDCTSCELGGNESESSGSVRKGRIP